MSDSHLPLERWPRGQGIQFLWRGTSGDLQPMLAGTDSSLFPLRVCLWSHLPLPWRLQQGHRCGDGGRKALLKLVLDFCLT